VSVDRREVLAILIGGGVGGALRAAAVELAPTATGDWPWATFGVNVAGCLLLGYFVTRLQERLPLSAYQRPFLGTGLCGALTTFSTFQLELVRMLEHGRPVLAAVYAVVSVAAGFAAVLVSTGLARRARLAA
jgi:CrcB protein